MDRPDGADVAAAAAGDGGAFERLVRGTQGRLWRYVVHLVGDPSLAEDVVQEVYLRAHRKLGTLRDPDRFLPWLLTMARNASYDAGRSRARRPVRLVGDWDAENVRASPDTHIGIDVYEALAGLDYELREALILVAMIELTYDEAADAIGVPTGTVKSRVFRARKRLLDSLDPEGGRRGH